AAGLGSGCFCYLLQGTFWESMVAFGIGMMLYVFILFAEKHKLTKIIVNIVGGALITVLAIGFSLYFPYPVGLDQVIIGSIMPLVPGVAFTNAIRDIANSDFISGTVRMIDALLVFVYIAIGVGFILGCYSNLLGGILI
ncbi:MAG: threonine/serine exporter family protein, partial [Lachnospiraceae bacterium]